MERNLWQVKTSKKEERLDRMKQPPGTLLVTLLFALSLPTNALEAKGSEDQKLYCNRWAYRFLSIKDGANFINNKISAKKFPKYIDLCLENYDELQNYYKNLNNKVTK